MIFINKKKSVVQLLGCVLILALLNGCSAVLTEPTEPTEPSDSANEPTLQQTSDSIIALAPEQKELTAKPANADAKETTNTSAESIADPLEVDDKPDEVKKSYQQQQAALIKSLPADVLPRYQQATQLMREKNWQAAVLIFDQLIIEQPKLSGSYVNKAIIAQQQNQAKEAEQLLLTAIAVNADNPNAHNVLAQHYRKQGEFIKAEQHYLTALTLAPERIEIHLNLAVLYELYQGNYSQAKQHYAAYLAQQPDDKKVQRWAAGLALKAPALAREP